MLCLCREAVDQSGEKSCTVTKTRRSVSEIVAVLPVALPGLTNYDDSSDSISSSSDSEPDFQLATKHAVIIRQQNAHS